jgi:hypothetical protein
MSPVCRAACRRDSRCAGSRHRPSCSASAEPGSGAARAPMRERAWELATAQVPHAARDRMRSGPGLRVIGAGPDRPPTDKTAGRVASADRPPITANLHGPGHRCLPVVSRSRDLARATSQSPDQRTRRAPGRRNWRRLHARERRAPLPHERPRPPGVHVVRARVSAATSNARLRSVRCGRCHRAPQGAPAVDGGPARGQSRATEPASRGCATRSASWNQHPEPSQFRPPHETRMIAGRELTLTPCTPVH